MIDPLSENKGATIHNATERYIATIEFAKKEKSAILFPIVTLLSPESSGDENRSAIATITNANNAQINNAENPTPSTKRSCGLRMSMHAKARLKAKRSDKKTGSTT